MTAFEVKILFLFFLINFLFLKDQRNRLNDLVIKSKDLKTKLYEECLPKDLVKVLIDKLDQIVVSLKTCLNIKKRTMFDLIE
jgi:hypothetical protein